MSSNVTSLSERRINEIKNRICKLPPTPWVFLDRDDFDHWVLFGHVVDDIHFLLSLINQTECSKREDSYQQLSTEYLNGKEHWETDPSERISIQCFASWLDRRCGTLNTEDL